MAGLIPFSGTSRTITETTQDSKAPNSLEKQPSLFSKWLKGKTKEPLELAEAIDVNENIDSFKQLKMKNFDPQILYQSGRWDPRVKFIRTSVEESLKVGDGDNVIIPLVSKETIRKIKEQKEHVHLGLIIFGIKRMHRGNMGTKVLAIIFDDRFSEPAQALLAQMEIDMNQPVSLFYCAPNYFLKTKDLGHIKFGIQSKGYGPLSQDNIQITRGLLGKGTQNSSVNYRCQIDDVIEGISSKGCVFLKPPQFDGNRLAGESWDITPLLSPAEKAYVPTNSNVYTTSIGNTSIRFSQYQEKGHPTNSNSILDIPEHEDE